MQFDLLTATAILIRIPDSFHGLLHGMNEEWTNARERPGTWNAKDVLSHLIFLDKNNWLRRVRLMLSSTDPVRFDPLDRWGGNRFKALDIPELLKLFRHTRRETLQELDALRISRESYQIKAIHPDFGEVQLSQLLSAWVVHDLSHLSQVCRIMARQYSEEVGPWIAFLRILNT